MASNKVVASTALLLSLNLLFFSMVSSADVATTQPTTCSIDTAQLSVCANVLNLVNIVTGSPETLPCCNLISGLADLEAAVCLCTAFILGINLNIPLSLTILLNACGHSWPSGFECS